MIQYKLASVWQAILYCAVYKEVRFNLGRLQRRGYYVSEVAVMLVRSLAHPQVDASISDTPEMVTAST